MLLKLESESAMQKYALESGIRIRPFFGRIAIPGVYDLCLNFLGLQSNKLSLYFPNSNQVIIIVLLWRFQTKMNFYYLN